MELREVVGVRPEELLHCLFESDEDDKSANKQSPSLALCYLPQRNPDPLNTAVMAVTLDRGRLLPLDLEEEMAMVFTFEN